MKKVFITDLDNTLIYSNKHEMNNPKTIVENHNGLCSYMNSILYDNFEELNKEIQIIPITTRDYIQYQRIMLPIIPEYALCLNGAILLHNGSIDFDWLEDSRRIVKSEKEEIIKAYDLINNGEISYMKLNVKGNFFLFIHSRESFHIFNLLKKKLDSSKVDIFRGGNSNYKVYVFPKSLNKGTAVKRLKEMIRFDYMISSGDSEIDESMLNIADKIISPDILKNGGSWIYE